MQSLGKPFCFSDWSVQVLRITLILRIFEKIFLLICGWHIIAAKYLADLFYLGTKLVNLNNPPEMGVSFKIIEFYRLKMVKVKWSYQCLMGFSSLFFREHFS